ncbi:amino acid ABC transporter permease [Staphylococcus muscae]|uniref:ABC transporter permease n=1 Tax=Staphylococcus muscae TaxID=1294 RepID=A0A240C8L6_9STAP|nr:amino acid ABC transporter permease [Staphylococcus muscae]AVQ33797.1 amino acid ABC transporter permease [Staphylococcus muscae]PNZ06304.1 amino acid ABC transporter permease [Staphylococcus muscae]GGA87803.1 ABC transporter permease [Staphylococcus muscae]SNW04300.1 amino acid ABC transporter permease [Staphylococcus muscae]
MSFMIEAFTEVLKGVPYTIAVAVVAIIVGLLIGSLFALIQFRRIPVLSQIIIVYNSFMRSTPLIVQLFIFYYGLPALILWLNAQFHWKLNPDMFHPLVIALIAFSLHAVAYLSESIKGGLLAVSQDQYEAAQTIGLSKWHLYTRIVLPQAYGYALPNIENQFIMLIKGTSLAFAIQIPEIMGVSAVIANEGYRFVEVYTIAVVFYWVLAIVLEYLFHRLEGHTTRYLRA